MIDPRYGFVYTTNEQMDKWMTSINTIDFSAGILGYTPMCISASPPNTWQH